MVNKYKAYWEQCLQLIRSNVTSQQYETWFAPIVFESFSPESNTLLVQVPSPFVYEYLEQHFVGLLSKVLSHCFGTNVRLTYRIVTDKAHNLSQDIEADQPTEIDEPRPHSLHVQEYRLQRIWGHSCSSSEQKLLTYSVCQLFPTDSTRQTLKQSCVHL